MILYTIQPICVYEAICREGEFHSFPIDSPDSELNNWSETFKFKVAYDWVVSQMDRRGLMRPIPNSYPVWAYFSVCGTKKPRPDLRYYHFKSVAKEKRLTLLTLNIPDNEVMLFDYDLWSVCFSYSYIGTVRASEEFERKCKRHGVSLYGSSPLPDPLHSELLKSWEILLDLERVRQLTRTRKENHTVQATFWNLKAEYIVDAIEFGNGKLKRKLATPKR